MIKFVIKRLIGGIITIILVIILVFFMIHSIPGSPFTSQVNLPENIKQNVINKYGLDKPLHQQLIAYFDNILHGDLGMSIKSNGRTVNSIISEHLPISMIIGGISVILCIIIAIPLGVLAATHESKLIDIICRFFSIITASTPGFVVAVLFQYIFCVKLKWFPSFTLSNWTAIILPISVLILYPFAIIFQLIRNNMIEELKKDYIIMAKMSGISNNKILYKYALKNACIPLINYLSPVIVSVLTGSFAVEKVFGIPGIGRYFITSVLDSDYTVVLGLTVFFTILMVTFNLFSDIFYKILNPRVVIE